MDQYLPSLFGLYEFQFGIAKIKIAGTHYNVEYIRRKWPSGTSLPSSPDIKKENTGTIWMFR
jgi:hypothetical protein